MSRVVDQLAALWPALAFLLAGVPLAALLDRLGFFRSAADVLASRPGPVPVGALWVLGAATTAVLNLDTTVVLLTPLYLELARRGGVDPVPLALIPLLLASLSSSVLPVSNLTTLLAAEHYGLGVAEMVGHLALPGLAATVVGWLAYRRRHPPVVAAEPSGPPDRRALAVGGAVVAGLLVGFVVGPDRGVAPWVTALVADGVLMAVTRYVPWRHVPLTTAAGVAAVASILALAPALPVGRLPGAGTVAGVGALVVAGAAAANTVNNLPGLLAVLDAEPRISWPVWSWLLGVTTGAALLPIGALANLLWLRILRAEGLAPTWRRYIALTLPVAGPALLAAALTLAGERAVFG
ncbi:MAG: hypothetical protein R2761_11305 [Acidimicrobiales bacterium]